MYEQSHRESHSLCYLHHRPPGYGLLTHTMDNAITYKAQRDKNARELKLANAAITDMQMRQRDVAALDAKYTKELADAKAENDALRGCCRWSSSVAHQSSSSVSGVKPLPPPADNSPDWQTPLNGIISLQREADHYAKTTGRNPEAY